MINNKLALFCFISLFLLVSCDSKKAQERDADLKLKHIEELIARNALNSAKIELDSIHALYPRLVSRRRVAAALQDTILRRENSRSIEYCRSVLPKKESEVDSLKKMFRFEKNEKYQESGNYVYKTLITENNSSRSFLKSYVDEGANMFMVSNYCGGKISHTQLQVSMNDIFAHTDTLNINSAAYHSFDNDGLHWETLTFKNEEDRGVMSFIAQHADLNLKVTLRGTKNYSYIIGSQDKKALKETYKLWIAMKDVRVIKKEIEKSSAILLRIKNQRY